jgi:hypothetical protein
VSNKFKAEARAYALLSLPDRSVGLERFLAAQNAPARIAPRVCSGLRAMRLVRIFGAQV